jgi:hypothetical protein
MYLHPSTGRLPAPPATSRTDRAKPAIVVVHRDSARRDHLLHILRTLAPGISVQCVARPEALRQGNGPTVLLIEAGQIPALTSQAAPLMLTDGPLRIVALADHTHDALLAVGYGVTDCVSDCSTYLQIPRAPLRTQMTPLLNSMHHTNNECSDRSGHRPHRKHIAIDLGTKIVVVKTDDIVWIEADGGYAYIHTSKRRYTVRKSLNLLEETLDPRRFQRCHKSAIVDMDRVEYIERRTGRDRVVVLRDGTRVRLGRKHVGAIIARIGGALNA